MKKLEILYEDDNVIIINKPAGLAVQGGKGVKISVDKILAEIKSPPPLLVHRLDKDTSGVLLTAKGRAAAARLSGLIAGKHAVKQYTAVCAGSFKKSEGVITDGLLIRGSLKNSQTRYKVIKTGGIERAAEEQAQFDANIAGNAESLYSAQRGFSVVELELGTGRTHQIRRHLSMNGNPVLGDDKYGDFSLNKKLRKEAGLKRLLLHASRLAIKELNIDIISPLPEYFRIFV